MDDLLGGFEVAKLLGVSNTWVHRLMVDEPRFPPPIQRLNAGYVWLREDIERYKAGERPLHHQPYDLIGTAEAAELYKVSKQRLRVLVKLPGFPAPLARPRLGLIWNRSDLERFLSTWPRRPGRQPTA